MANLVRQFGKNIFTSWASLAIRVLLVFLVNPFIIHTLGNDQYGVWVLVISILNYITILDLGLKQALVRFISKYMGVKDYDRINSVLSTAFLIYNIVGVLVIILTLFLSYFALDQLNIPDQYMFQGRVALIIMGINMALGFFWVVRGDSLGAFHRYDITYGLMILEDVLRTAAIIILLKCGYGLIPFALAFFVFSQLKLAAGAGFQRRLFPFVKIRLRWSGHGAAREVFKYGLISFLISVAWLFISNTDNVLIGYFLSTSAVTKYSIAAGFIVYLRAFIHAVSFPLRPMISHYDAVDKIGNIRFIYTRGTKYFYFLTFLVGGITLVFGDHLISLWMGPGYEESAMILKILVLPAAVFLPQALAASVMYGVDKHRNLLYIIIVEGMFNLILSVILVKRYGLAGIAYGTVIPQIIIYLIIVPMIIRPILNIDLRRFYLSFVYSAGGALGISYISGYLLTLLLTPDGWAVFFAEVAAVILISILFGYLVFDREETRIIFNRLRGRD
ncbi:MAG: hypothetical protein DRP46_03905 [Candidatus Zixiibacteriota bacterium]|nr:MAG: hypothetical protein DRP46_03905 [candidate division Zixibacteria bacterium]HDL02494.1 hypothetical protein [candidate division Zixibacteria bacterium]